MFLIRVHSRRTVQRQTPVVRLYRNTARACNGDTIVVVDKGSALVLNQHPRWTGKTCGTVQTSTHARYNNPLSSQWPQGFGLSVETVAVIHTCARISGVIRSVWYHIRREPFDKLSTASTSTASADFMVSAHF